MAERFINIAITLPGFFAGETDAIAVKLSSGEADYVHIRKPGSSEADVRALIESIPVGLRPRLTLHDHFGLAPLVGGVHLNSRNPGAPAGWQGRVSASLHSVEEAMEEKRHLDYITLSPIFPSISKPGYMPSFIPGELQALLREPKRLKIIALGGVEPRRTDEVRAMGFDGAAMLGAAWRTRIRPADFQLQFITNPTSADEAARQSADALRGGCRWIQLRWKDATAGQLKDAAYAIAPLCRSNGAVFLLDDHVELVAECEADGVHLGKNDMPVAEAHRLLGPTKIIGATANTPDDILAAAEAGADYIGYGPFRFTTTKKNLSPVLGLDGYRKAVEACRARGIALPIVAIGGITADDIPAIMATGVDGIAVSGSIINAADSAEAAAGLYEIITDNNLHIK